MGMNRDFAAFVLATGLGAAACQFWGLPFMFGGAAAVWLAGRAAGGGRDRVGRALCGGAFLLAVSLASVWGAIAAAALLAGMALAEGLLAEDVFAGCARFLAAALCLVALLFEFVPAATGRVAFDASLPSAGIFAAGVVCEAGARFPAGKEGRCGSVVCGVFGGGGFCFCDDDGGAVWGVFLSVGDCAGGLRFCGCAGGGGGVGCAVCAGSRGW